VFSSTVTVFDLGARGWFMNGQGSGFVWPKTYNEQVIDGRCWRCGTLVTKKELKQRYFQITDYADRLLEDLGAID
jgi:hypothetical protein